MSRLKQSRTLIAFAVHGRWIVTESMESFMVTGVASFNELVCTFVDLVLMRFRGPISASSRRRKNSRPLPAT
jgi:hypothetical protein